MRSFAPPTRDKIFIWSAVVAGCGIMALLGRHAAINRFGTDHFTGNVLFAVFFVLSIGLYCGLQSVIEDVFNRLQSLFRRREVMAIAEITTGEQIAIPTGEEPGPSIMECSAPAQDFVADNYPEVTFSTDSNEEIEEDAEYLTLEDGTHIKVGAIDIDDVVFDNLEDKNRIKQDDGKIRIEEWEEEAYIDANGDVYYSDQIEAALQALKTDKQHSEIQRQRLLQHEQCNAAHAELAEEDMKFSLAQIEFICAYITFMMQPYLEADELQKLHHNAKIWTVNAMPPFTPVNLRSNHLTKEDLKHLGYNVGKFLRLQGGVIARFVKKVFEKPFENTHIRTIEQKLREKKSNKERIPIHTDDQMDKLFKHFQRYGNINLDILNRA